jgi:hypothetical protein
MAGRRIHDEREAREALDQVARTGSDRVNWAREQGIDPRSLNAWRLNLARRDRREHPALRLVELVAAPVTAPDSDIARPVLQVRCGTFVVDVRPDVDDRLLARVLALVASC